jgi:murein DD-endopeptidase MepM/ murein hydrolase activator NlpD
MPFQLRQRLKELLAATFIGADGKISYTAVAALHGVILFWTVYVQLYLFQWEFSDGLLTFTIEVLLLFFGARTLQRATVLGAGAIRRGATDAVVAAAQAPAKEKKPAPVARTEAPPSAPVKPITRRSSAFINPTEGRLTSPFGMRNGRMHNGVDIAKKGNVPVFAAASGKVIRSYFHNRGGESIIMEHHLNGQYYVTLYAHLRENSRAVVTGDTVMQGQLIGYMGNTGVSTGQHLHFEIHEGGWNVERSNARDPLNYISI